jgi:hypothetical protein
MARTLNIEIRKIHESWSDRAGEEYTVTPELAPADATTETTSLVGRFYPGYEALSLGRERFWGSSSFGRGTFSVFFKTLQHCFNEHYPFSIRPEVLWYLIVHEVALTVKRDPERYRLHFSSTDEKQTIEVLAGDNLPTNWAPFLSEFSSNIRGRMPSEIGELLCPRFSTSTVESDAATSVAFMEAASPFYDYRMRLSCGLPLIRLEGEVEDYLEILDRAKALKIIFGKDLGIYFTHLIPVLQKIADQAGGAPVDHEFWGAIYNHESGSGGSDGSDELGGWITAFVNYIRKVSGEYYGDAQSTVVQKPLEVFDWTKRTRWLSVGMVPNHVSSADLVVTRFGTSDELPLKFIGGILAVELEEGFVSPQLSYGVLVGKQFAQLASGW